MSYTTSQRATKTIKLPKEVWIGWISSLVEAYNMAIYSFIAPILATQLFQESSSENAVFFSYALVFMGSCFFYPLGAIYYGLLGDKKGRQKTCIYSTLGLAIATGLMGLVPIHILAENAWICFLVFICAQHFFSGGEYHGSIIFSLEHSDEHLEEHSREKQSGLMSSLSCLFAVFGLVAANGLATLSYLMNNEFWIRVCFFLGALGGIISYLLKNQCQETPAFAALPQKSLVGVNWSHFLQSNWREIGRVVSVIAFFLVSYTFIFIFLPLIHTDQIVDHHFDTFKSLIAYGAFLVTGGLIADQVGIQKNMLGGLWLFSLAIIPACYLCNSLFILQILLTIFACLVIGPIHGWMLNQFQAQNRCRGIFISSAIATSIFGGSTVPICLMLFEESDSLVICCLYPLSISLGSLVCLLLQKKKIIHK